MGSAQCNLRLGKSFIALDSLKKLRERIPEHLTVLRLLAFTQTRCRLWQDALQTLRHLEVYAKQRRDRLQKLGKDAVDEDEEAENAEMLTEEAVSDQVASLEAYIFSQMRDDADHEKSLALYFILNARLSCDARVEFFCDARH